MILLRKNKAKKDIQVKGTFNEVISSFSKKENCEVTDCRLDDKNKTLWINGINMCTIVHPDNI